jgi:predicted HNH restriction endonuclease
MTLEVDHLNGDRSDDRLDNLRLLCPNCHAVTGTWCRGGR